MSLLQEQTGPNIASTSVATLVSKGSLYSIGSSAITIVSGFIRSTLLARLLTPDDFGVVTLALFFISLAGQISDFGFTKALIHRDTDILEAASAHFILRTGLAAFTALLLVLASPLLARLYPTQPEMIKALLVLSLFHVISALNSTPEVLLKKNLDFKFITALDVATSLAMTIGSVAMAFFGLGFWSLVGMQAIAVLIRSLGLWGIKRSWKPILKLDKTILHWYFQFGSFVFLSSLFTKLLDQFDDFWAGTALGSTALGFYSRAYEFAGYSQRVVGSPIALVFFPTYAKLQHDRLKLSQAFFRVSSLMVRAGFLFSLVFILVIPEFVRIFLGEIWLAMVLPFRLMVIYTLLDPLSETCGQLLTAVGQPRLLSRIKFYQLLLFIPAVIVLAHLWEIDGIAVAADLMLIAGLGLMLRQAKRFVDFSLSKLFRNPSLGFLLGASVTMLISFWFRTENDWLALLIKSGIAICSYSGFLFLMEHKEYIKTFRMLYARLKPEQS